MIALITTRLPPRLGGTCSDFTCLQWEIGLVTEFQGHCNAEVSCFRWILDKYVTKQKATSNFEVAFVILVVVGANGVEPLTYAL